MDVYDFDGTLYAGDSTRDFLVWCARRHPSIVLTLPRTGLAALACFGTHGQLLDKTRFKSVLYRFLPRIPDIERELDRFWKTHAHLIGGPCSPAPGDLVISASPEFLLRKPCSQHGWNLIASEVDPHTGRVLGPNCSNDQKVVRFRERYGDAPIERFYSDSRNDDPLAHLAQEAWLVDIPSATLSPWPRMR